MIGLRQLRSKVGLIFITISCSIFLLLGCWASPAWATPQWATPNLASLHTYHEKPGVTTLRSKLSLRDRHDRTWQTILFKRSQNDQVEHIYLRIIGFPGITEITPKQAIQISTGTGMSWVAQPKLDAQTTALPSNAAQYDVQAFTADLQGDIPLEISLVLSNNQTAKIVIPPFVVHEWRTVINQTLLGL